MDVLKGTETLKNLVLGGIGAFTVVDIARVEPRDLGNNWLLAAGSVGASRAELACSALHELNEAVEGAFVEESTRTLLDARPEFFKAFTLVIATQECEQTLVKLDEVCRREGVPLLAARSYGLLGSLRVSKSEHCVVEAKPDSEVEDLRLHSPWEELEAFVREFRLGELDDATHAHVPFAVLLVQAMQEYKASNNGELPKTSKEKAAVKDALRQLGRRIDQENVREAVASAYKAWTVVSIPSDLRALLEVASTVGTAPDAPQFWLLAAALGRFVEKEGNGRLPLEGSIPDMTSTTEFYLKLQRIYQDKARADAEAVLGHARSILVEAGVSPESIQYDTVRVFCKNAHHLSVTRYRTLAEETGSETCDVEAVGKLLASEDSVLNASAYVLLRSCDKFEESYNRLPGVFDSEIDEDVSRLKSIAASLLTQCYGVNNAGVDEDLLCEVVRFGGSELHAVASVMGGIAAQEAIKLLTCQFVPLAGTLIYNAINSTSTVITL